MRCHYQCPEGYARTVGPGHGSHNSAQTLEFGSAAKDMCSACLTPVYPMEKMVANKLILHNNCFCCKHCKKKLSIHNYSSLYGEFYCISHYQQLFKRTGNYDEGFGHKQHKDRWLQNNKGTDEPDVVPTPKMTKSNLNTSNVSRESSAGVLVKQLSTREMGCNSADVKGKLKMSWPPEKKSPGVKPAQQTYVKNKIYDIGKASTLEHHRSGNNHGGEMKDKVKKVSSSFISGDKERSKTSGYNSAETFPPGETKRSITVTNQKTGVKHGAPAPKTTYNPTSNSLDVFPNKARKSVRFSPNIDVAQYDLSSELTTGVKGEEHSAQLSDQTEQSNKSKDIKDVSDKNNTDHLSFEFSEEQSDSEEYVEIPEYKCHGGTSSTANKESDVEVESGQEVPQTDITVLNGVVDKLEGSSFTETLNSSEEAVKYQEPSEVPHVIPRNPYESESTPHSPAGHMIGEEASLERNKNQFEKTESADDHEGCQKKPVARTNSLKGSAKQAEKTKVKLGSWSKGKSPLSKFFTSGGNDKTNKAEPKDAKKPDVKPSGGLLGRLFQSSSEKAEDATKSAAQDERNDKKHDDDKEAEEVKLVSAKEMQKEGDMSEVPPQVQDSGEQIQEKSHSAETSTLESNVSEAVSKSTEPSNLLKTQETGDDLTAPEQTHNQESDLQSVGLSATDPGKKDFPNTVESVSQTSEESIDQVIAEEGGEEVLSAPFNPFNNPFNDILGDSVSSAPIEPLAIQINTDESAHELLDASDAGGRDLGGGAFLDLNGELPQDSSNPFGLENTPSDTFASSFSDAALPEAAPADTFSLLDPHTTSAENDVMFGLMDQLIVPASAPVNQDEDQTSSPFGTNNQTRDEGADFDIFGSNDVLFTQPVVNVPHQGEADASSNQASCFPDDIFGVADVFAAPPFTPATSSSLNDLLSSDTYSSAAPSAQTDVVADGIFASEPQLLPVYEPSDVNLFADSLLVSDNSSAEQTAVSTVTNSSWMDDLLG